MGAQPEFVLLVQHLLVALYSGSFHHMQEHISKIIPLLLKLGSEAPALLGLIPMLGIFVRIKKIAHLLCVRMELIAILAPEGRKKMHTVMRTSLLHHLESGDRVISHLLLVTVGAHRLLHIIFIGKGNSFVKDVVKVLIGTGRTVLANGAMLAFLKLRKRIRNFNPSKSLRRIVSLL